MSFSNIQCSDALMKNDTESNDYSITETNFSNAKKYVVRDLLINSYIPVQDDGRYIKCSDETPAHNYDFLGKISNTQRLQDVNWNQFADGEYDFETCIEGKKTGIYDKEKSFEKKRFQHGEITLPNNGNSSLKQNIYLSTLGHETSSQDCNSNWIEVEDIGLEKLEKPSSCQFQSMSAVESCHAYDNHHDHEAELLENVHLADHNLFHVCAEDKLLKVKNSSQSVEDLYLYSRKASYGKKLYTPLEEGKINQGTSENLRYSTLDLRKEPTHGNLRLKRSSSFHSLNKNKSYSLGNLSSIKTKYDHIQSKVKQYIQERKKQESELKGIAATKPKSESKSLPATPIRRSTLSTIEQEVLMLDEKALESLSLSNVEQEKELPEDLKALKQEILSGDSKSNVLISTLFTYLKKERECRIDQDNTLNKLQLSYDNLLAQYAEAKNAIDNLRFNKDFHGRSYEGSTPLPNDSSNFKKAFSMSNICIDSSASVFENRRRSINFVAHSSSPIADHNICVPLIRDKCISLSSLSVGENNLIKGKEDISACSSSSDKPVMEWFNKSNYVNQKLQEYFILETSSALEEHERNVVWDYIIEKFAELSSGLNNIDIVTVQDHGCKQKLEEIRQTIESLANQFGGRKPHKQLEKHKLYAQDENSAASLDHPSIPPNNTFPCKESSRIHSSVDCPRSKSPKETLSYQMPAYVKHMKIRDVDSGCPPSDRSLVDRPRAKSPNETQSYDMPVCVKHMQLKDIDSACLSLDRRSSVDHARSKSPRETPAYQISGCVKHMQLKDIDSGCPPSDRSTRNSHYASIDHIDSLNIQEDANTNLRNSGSALKTVYIYEHLEPVGYQEPSTTCIKLSSISLGIEDNVKRRKDCNKLKEQNKVSSKQSISANDENYDASGSSDIDEFSAETDLRKVRKKHWKPCKSSNNRILQKYEDKFVCPHRPEQLCSKLPISHSSRAKYYSAGLSQIEKNSKYIENQVSNLKSKGLQRSKWDSSSPIPSAVRQNIPLKAVNKGSLNLSNFSEESSANSPNSSFVNLKSLSSDLPVTKILDSLPKKTNRYSYPRPLKENYNGSGLQYPSSPSRSQNLFNPNITSPTTCKKLTCPHKPSTEIHNRKWNISQHCSRYIRRESVPLADLRENSHLVRKYNSVPSLYGSEHHSPPPFIYIEHYNRCKHKKGSSHASPHLSRRNQEMKSMSPKKKKLVVDKDLSLLDSLNEATYLAETLRLRSHNVLQFLKNDVISTFQP